MRARLSPALRLFRVLVTGMLVMALIAKPLLAELCDVHELTHLVAAAGKAGAHVDTAAEAQSDRDHARGAHRFLHAFDMPAAFVELFPALTVPPALFAQVAPPAYVALAPPARAFDSPFRPPIA